MKDDLAVDLAEDWAALVASAISFSYVAHEPEGSSPPPPGWRGEERALVAAVDRGSAICTGLTAPLVSTGVGPCAFHGWPVRAALADRAASRSGLVGGGSALGGLESGVMTWYLSNILYQLFYDFGVNRNIYQTIKNITINCVFCKFFHLFGIWLKFEITIKLTILKINAHFMNQGRFTVWCSWGSRGWGCMLPILKINLEWPYICAGL